MVASFWQEAYGGWSSGLIWVLVIHSAQREIRERHHYSVDCVVAIYMGFLLWKMTGFIWSSKDDASIRSSRRLVKLDKIQGQLFQAAKDSDMDKVRDLLNEVEVESSSSDFVKGKAKIKDSPQWAMKVFGCITMIFTLTVVFLAFTWTSDG